MTFMNNGCWVNTIYNIFPLGHMLNCWPLLYEHGGKIKQNMCRPNRSPKFYEFIYIFTRPLAQGSFGKCRLSLKSESNPLT